MNAQAINFNNLLKSAQTQNSQGVSNIFDAPDNKFSKTFNEIVSKYDKKSRSEMQTKTKQTEKNVQKTDGQKSETSSKTSENIVNNKPQADKSLENQSALSENKDLQQKEAPEQPKTEIIDDSEAAEAENADISKNEQITQAETEVILAETDVILENAAQNSLNLSQTGEIPANMAALSQTAENIVDSEENHSISNRERINNLKTRSTTTIASISTNSDDAESSKNASKQVILTEIDADEQIKASEKVVQEAKDGIISQTKELSSQAKQTVLENLQSIQGADTTVVESKSFSKSDSQSGGNSSFSQGNAAEQVIKMSIENADADNVLPVANNSSVSADKSVQTAASASKTLDLNKSDILNQIGTKMLDLPESGQSKVTIILKPEHLGRIQVEILNTGDGITARMLTENQQVKELLDKNMETLKSQLGAQGVNVNNIKVENTQQTAQNSMNFEQEQFSRDFSRGSQGHHAANSDSAKAYEENNLEFVDETGEIEPEIAQSQIIHDGKIDYKV